MAQNNITHTYGHTPSPMQCCSVVVDYFNEKLKCVLIGIRKHDTKRLHRCMYECVLFGYIDLYNEP